MNRRALTALVVVAAVVFGVADVRNRARLDRGPKAHRTDLTVYLAAADALARGDDPYEARSPRGWRYVYPPLLAVVARPLTALPVPDAALVVYGLSALAVALAARTLARTLGTRPVVLALLAASPFFVQAFQRGQVTPVLLALQVAAGAAWARGRGAWAGLLLALGVALRLTPLLPAGMLGLAALLAAARGDHAAWRFPLGFAAGLVAAFVGVPVLALGPARAHDVTLRWLEVGRDVYAAEPGSLADLGRDYAINEWSFKNQGVRRVAGTTLARLEGLPVAPDGRPALGDREARADLVALAVAALAALAALVVAARRMRAPGSPEARAAFALGLALPVACTRYVYPVHLVVLVPLLAEVAAALPARRAVVAAAAWGVALLGFYGAHVRPALRPFAEHGGLLLGVVAIAVLAPRPASAAGASAAGATATGPTAGVPAGAGP